MRRASRTEASAQAKPGWPPAAAWSGPSGWWFLRADLIDRGHADGDAAGLDCGDAPERPRSPELLEDRAYSIEMGHRAGGRHRHAPGSDEMGKVELVLAQVLSSLHPT